MTTESQILHQIGRFWVCAEKFGRRQSPGYAVYRDTDSGTHSERVASFGFPGTEGLERAKADADRRHFLSLPS